MGEIITIVNQKGGVGKTTTAINLSTSVAMLGKRVLVVDFDPQANCSSGLGITDLESNKNIYEIIMNKIEVNHGISKTKINNCYIIPSSIHLTGASVELVEVENGNFFLKKSLEKVKNEYDYIFVDCPPSLGVLTLNGLVAADSVLIPIQTEYFALEGLTQLINTVNLVKQNLNPDLSIQGVLLTMLDKRTHLTDDVAKNVISYFGKKVYKTMIPRNVRIAEAPSFGVPVILHDQSCIGAKAYEALAREFING
ncbi:MAG: AAA family ATPase [Spirochaetes bacterium]|nr:AAA family ATPase [Spirochaetota bacterium]